ncbi:MAG: hypothetical protein P4M00_07895 [Azospirillaceae bacterium]|nr:hypothetical protein [Azospirillaceae bacterium]
MQDDGNAESNARLAGIGSGAETVAGVGVRSTVAAFDRGAHQALVAGGDDDDDDDDDDDNDDHHPSDDDDDDDDEDDDEDFDDDEAEDEGLLVRARARMIAAVVLPAGAAI